MVLLSLFVLVHFTVLLFIALPNSICNSIFPTNFLKSAHLGFSLVIFPYFIPERKTGKEVGREMEGVEGERERERE